MALTEKKIFLDFYINNIVTVNAKQLDTNARQINVTCTDHGKKVALDPENMSVFIRYKKSDGNIVFNDGYIQSDGTVNIVLTQQMLASVGRQKVDLVIVALGYIESVNLSEIDGIYKLKDSDDKVVTVISTMSFFINVYETAIEHDTVSSTSEFEALLRGISRLVEVEDDVKKAEAERVESETDRDAAEQERKSNEEIRISNERDRNSRFTTAITNAQNATKDANTAASNANNAASSANTAASNANNAASSANNAATNANNAAQDCRDALQNGAIYQSEKGVANGVAVLDENAKVSVDQLYTVQTYNDIHNKTGLVYSTAIVELEEKEINPLYDAVAGLSRQIENLPHIYSGTDVPDNSIGKDGDIYLKIIG